MQLLKKLNLQLIYDPTIVLLGLYPKELKSEAYRNIYTPVFIVSEHSLALPFFGIGMKTELFQSCGHC